MMLYMKNQSSKNIKDLHNLSCNYKNKVSKLIFDIKNVNYN